MAELQRSGKLSLVGHEDHIRASKELEVPVVYRLVSSRFVDVSNWSRDFVIVKLTLSPLHYILRTRTHVSKPQQNKR